MDYQELFAKYLEGLEKEKSEIGTLKIKIAIHTWLDYSMKMLKNEKMSLEECLKNLEEYQKKIEVFENKKSEFLTQGFNRFLYYYKMKYNVLLSYFTLLKGLKKVIKNYKENDKMHLFVLHILLHLFIESFNEETITFNENMQEVMEQFKNLKVPEMTFETNIDTFKNFVTQTLCHYSHFDFQSYHRELLKKEN